MSRQKPSERKALRRAAALKGWETRRVAAMDRAMQRWMNDRYNGGSLDEAE